MKALERVTQYILRIVFGNETICRSGILHFNLFSQHRQNTQLQQAPTFMIYSTLIALVTTSAFLYVHFQLTVFLHFVIYRF